MVEYVAYRPKDKVYKRPEIKYIVLDDGMYEAQGDYWKYFPKYKKWLHLPDKFVSDGATWAPDIDSDGWWWHDLVCRKPVWADGSPVSDKQASYVLSYTMEQEGYTIRSSVWGLFTRIWRTLKHKVQAII